MLFMSLFNKKYSFKQINLYNISFSYIFFESKKNNNKFSHGRKHYLIICYHHVFFRKCFKS